MKQTTVVLIDDHSIMRMGLISLLNTSGSFTVLGDAGDGETGIKKALKLRPEVVIIDLMMPVMDGVETTRRLLEAWPEARVLILTTFGTAEGLARALEVGACGAILKSADWKEFRAAINDIATGKRYIASEIEQIIAENPPLPALSPRQGEILQLLVKGLTNEEIANVMHISKAVVKEHLTILFHKLDVSNRAEAIALALRKHLTSMAKWKM